MIFKIKLEYVKVLLTLKTERQHKTGLQVKVESSSKVVKYRN